MAGTLPVVGPNCLVDTPSFSYLSKMELWKDFFVAIAGASAALTGLIFVGISINLARIISIHALPIRALETLILLTTLLITSALCLVPEHPIRLIGLELLGIGIIVWIITLKMDISMLRSTTPDHKKHFSLNVLLTQLSVLPYIVAGIMILHHGFSGIYWLVPGIVFSFAKSIMDAWILLVEINR